MAENEEVLRLIRPNAKDYEDNDEFITARLEWEDKILALEGGELVAYEPDTPPTHAARLAANILWSDLRYFAHELKQRVMDLERAGAKDRYTKEMESVGCVSGNLERIARELMKRVM